MADTDLNRVFGRLTPGSQWLLSSAVPPHTLLEWRGPATQPTQQEIDDEWAIIEAEDAAQAAKESDAQESYDDALIDFSSLAPWQKSFTGAEMAAYIDANVTDMASAKTVMKGLAELLAAVRDVAKINYFAGE